ncbi:MAG: hypothetical protein ACI6PN_10000 [Polaribacter sp.]|uniref:hypothetical protein n=1 Tax=Polaribacter sp. TaxID=1920175 RepID=UPI000A58D827|nr:hypothetical protein [Polaribacter sp.]|tara:strand:- start:571 stop:840 length:270 start_codon:yes stop_codon:yes gene_type:complete
MLKRFKLSCDQATTICDKNQYGEASIKELITLKIHFIRCKICAIYTKQNTLLSVFYKGCSKDCKEVQHRLSLKEKEALKTMLTQHEKQG